LVTSQAVWVQNQCLQWSNTILLDTGHTTYDRFPMFSNFAFTLFFMNNLYI